MAAKNESHVGHSVPRLDDEGLSADEIQLRAQGHVGELPRQFTAFQTIAFSFEISNTWGLPFSVSLKFSSNIVQLVMQVADLIPKAHLTMLMECHSYLRHASVRRGWASGLLGSHRRLHSLPLHHIRTCRAGECVSQQRRPISLRVHGCS